jgi:hypothetical protein
LEKFLFPVWNIKKVFFSDSKATNTFFVKYKSYFTIAIHLPEHVLQRSSIPLLLYGRQGSGLHQIIFILHYCRNKKTTC